MRMIFGNYRAEAMKRLERERRSLMGACVALLLLAATSVVQAQVTLAPDAINYSGTLLDPSGAPLPDGQYVIAIFLMEVETGPSPVTGSFGVWGPLILDGTVGIGYGPPLDLVNGRFNVTLGPADPFDRDLAEAVSQQSKTGGDLFLDIWIFDSNVGTYVNQPNRQRILSAPFAAVAGNGPPPGTIIMWGGNTVPAGWLICDGTNGTPNLRDQFVRGASTLGTYASGLGSATHSHTMSAHTHSVSHTHNFTHTHTNPSHTHTADPASTTSTSYGDYEDNFGAGTMSVMGTHSHTVDIASFNTAAATPPDTSAPSITTTGSSSIATSDASATGATPSTAASNDPFFYKLAFIMKK